MRSLYNLSNEIIKLCERALQIYQLNNYCFIDFEDLFIENALMVGWIAPDLFFFREHMNSTSKLSDMLSYDHSGFGSVLPLTASGSDIMPQSKFPPLSNTSNVQKRPMILNQLSSSTDKVFFEIRNFCISVFLLK